MLRKILPRSSRDMVAVLTMAIQNAVETHVRSAIHILYYKKIILIPPVGITWFETLDRGDSCIRGMILVIDGESVL